MENPDAIVEQWFEEALDLPRGERTAFLDRTCTAQPELRREIEALLAENDRLTGFLRESPLAGLMQRSESATSEQRLGQGMRLGRYSLLEPLGAGGMGVVYRARDSKLQRIVAVKVLPQGSLTSDEVRSRFHGEALAIARLNHPNIAALYDAGEHDGIDYLVMECVPGSSLQEKLRDIPLSILEATRIARDIAEALEEPHASGVLHRDLKPSNIMITPQ